MATVLSSSAELVDLRRSAAARPAERIVRSAVSREQRIVQARLARAGITVGGDAPWDIRVHDDRAYREMLRGSLGFGESYMAGDFSVGALDELMERLFRSDLTADPLTPEIAARAVLARLVNFQSRARAFQVAETHYDADNDLFRAMLDREMVYTCGYWRDAKDLDEAQRAKMDLVCRKLGLERGMRVLDIGCGFGSFAAYAAETYGVSCVGYSVSKGQMEIARERCKGLPVELVLEDYRNIPAAGRTYDRVVSIGMLEAVGFRNYGSFMQIVADALNPDGAALVHTVGSNVSARRGDPWIDRYIFPNGMLPSIAQLGEAMEGRLVLEDLHNFGPDYDRTLVEWNARFQAAWPTLSQRYDERFKRMWELYLLAFAGGFRARVYQLWQLVLTKPGGARPPSRQS
jgi:cyclopropane-fatty-acyl-phospholipid synthase